MTQRARVRRYLSVKSPLDNADLPRLSMACAGAERVGLPFRSLGEAYFGFGRPHANDTWFGANLLGRGPNQHAMTHADGGLVRRSLRKRRPH